MKASTSILAIGAITSLLAIAPSVAQAAPLFFPSFQFGINMGPDGGDHHHRHAHDCLNDQEIADELQGQGYHHVDEVDQTRDTLIFDASMGHRMYELEVDSCTGEILSSTHIHR